jgi:hypothetical protein
VADTTDPQDLSLTILSSGALFPDETSLSQVPSDTDQKRGNLRGLHHCTNPVRASGT